MPNSVINPHFLISKFEKQTLEEGQILLLAEEVICFCTGLTRKRLQAIYQENQNITLNEVALKTQASFHCGGCKKRLSYELELLSAKSGKRAGEKEVKRSYVDSEGKRLKYLNEYPNAWIIKIHALHNEWMEREKFNENFSFMITDAPVPFVDFKLEGSLEAHKAKIYFEHFTRYVEEKTHAKWYFQLL